MCWVHSDLSLRKKSRLSLLGSDVWLDPMGSALLAEQLAQDAAAMLLQLQLGIERRSPKQLAERVFIVQLRMVF